MVLMEIKYNENFYVGEKFQWNVRDVSDNGTLKALLAEIKLEVKPSSVKS